MFFTASFFEANNHHGSIIPISRSVPGGKGQAEVRRRAAPFKDHPIRKLLAPPKALLDMYKAAEKSGDPQALRQAQADYARQYLEQLDARRDAILTEVLGLIRRGGQYTFLCWEKAGSFCHRNLVTGWLDSQGYGIYISGQDKPLPEKVFTTFISGARNYDADTHFDRVFSALDRLSWTPGEVLVTHTPGVSELAALWAGARGIKLTYFTPLSKEPGDIARQIYEQAEALSVLWDFDPAQSQGRTEAAHDLLDSLYVEFEKRDQNLVLWEDFAKQRRLGLIAA